MKAKGIVGVVVVMIALVAGYAAVQRSRQTEGQGQRALWVGVVIWGVGL